MIPPKASGAFVAAMEEALDVYKRPRDAQRPLVCLDEATKQLVKETRVPQLSTAERFPAIGAE